jgi:DNA-binding CsgD family transcriptional regulator/predicted ester cyclase
MILKDNLKKAKSIVEHIIYEQFGNGNFSMYEQFIARNVICHCPQSWQEIHTTHLKSRQSAKKIDQEYAIAFQFKKVEIADLIIDDDKIVVRWDSEGIHKGNFFDILATHRHFHLTGQTIYQFNKEEQIGTVWQSWDMLGLLGQIRDIPFVPDSIQDIDTFLKQAAFLSHQERECMRYLLQGKTAKETALRMKLSFRTIEYYFENIKDKLVCFRKKDLFTYARLLEKHRII